MTKPYLTRARLRTTLSSSRDSAENVYLIRAVNMYHSDLKFFSSTMLAIYRSYSKNRDEIKVMYEMHTSTDLSSAIPEFQEQQFSLLIAGPRGILSEEKRI